MPQIPTPIPGVNNDNRPADDYNWGYLLSVGLNEYKDKDIGILKHAVTSSQQAIKMLSYVKTGYWHYDYKHTVHLTNENATYINVVKAILNIASNTKSGDTVTLSFSGHGCNTFQGKVLGYTSPTLSEKGNYIKEFLQIGGTQNVMLLYDDILSECEMFFLLKFFKPNIKINLIFDMCHSGSWITKFHMDQASIRKCYQIFEDKLFLYDSVLYKYMVSINSYLYTGLDLDNTIHIIGGIHDSQGMSDAFNSVLVLYATILNTGCNKPKLFKKLYYEMYESMMLKKDNDGASMWKAFYYQYDNPKSKFYLLDNNNKPVLDEEGDPKVNWALVPEYDNKNPTHLEIHKNKLPIFEYLGTNTKLFENTYMFGVEDLS